MRWSGAGFHRLSVLQPVVSSLLCIRIVNWNSECVCVTGGRVAADESFSFFALRCSHFYVLLICAARNDANVNANK